MINQLVLIACRMYVERYKLRLNYTNGIYWYDYKK